MWHTDQRRIDAATLTAATSKYLSAAASFEQGSGKRRSLPGGETFARCGAELAGIHQRRTGLYPASTTVEGFRLAPALSDSRSQRTAGRISTGSARGADERATATVRRYPRPRSCRLRFGPWYLDLAPDCLGHGRGVGGSLSSRSWAQTASGLGLFGAAAPPWVGPRGWRRAGSLVPP